MKACLFCQKTDSLITPSGACTKCYVFLMRKSRPDIYQGFYDEYEPTVYDSKVISKACPKCERGTEIPREYCPEGSDCEWHEWINKVGSFSEDAFYGNCNGNYEDSANDYDDGCATAFRGSCTVCKDGCAVNEAYEDSEPTKCEYPRHDLSFYGEGDPGSWCISCTPNNLERSLCCICAPMSVTKVFGLIVCDECTIRINRLRRLDIGSALSHIDDSGEKLFVRMVSLHFSTLHRLIGQR